MVNKFEGAAERCHVRKREAGPAAPSSKSDRGHDALICPILPPTPRPSQNYKNLSRLHLATPISPLANMTVSETDTKVTISLPNVRTNAPKVAGNR